MPRYLAAAVLEHAKCAFWGSNWVKIACESTAATWTLERGALGTGVGATPEAGGLGEVEGDAAEVVEVDVEVIAGSAINRSRKGTAEDGLARLQRDPEASQAPD